jgi:hypothetical protein
MSKIARRARRQQHKKRQPRPYRPRQGSLPWLIMGAIQDRPGITEEAIIALVQDTPTSLYDGPRDQASVLDSLAELRERGVLRTGAIGGD